MRVPLFGLLIVSVASAALPLRFEQNNGQAPREARFVVKGVPYSACLTQAGARWFSAGQAVELRFAAAAPAAIGGESPLEGATAYLRGGDRRQWLANVPSFRKVRYTGIYPGIDAVFYGNIKNELEYDLIVQPGADAARIQLEFPGLRARVAANGDLILGKSRMLRPVVRQEDGTRVEASYRLLAGGRVGFLLGGYDDSQRLIVDPVISYGSYLGAVGGGTGESIAVDAQGNIYVTGTTSSNLFPTHQPFQEFFFGSNDVYVTKFDPSGTRLIYSTYIGSWADDRALDIAVDGEGNACVTGHTTSADFPVTAGAFQTRYAGGALVNGGDGFVLKLSPDGSRLLFSTFLGGSGNEYPRSIALDGDGNAYVAGSTVSEDFPLEKAVQGWLRGPRDIFVSKISADGARLIYSTYLGGEGTDEGYGIAVDGTGSAYVGGTTTNGTFPLVNELQSTYGGGTRDQVIAKFSQDGSELVYSTLYGGTGDDFVRGIAVDASGAAYVAGYAGNNTYPTKDRLRASAGNREAVLLKLAPNASEVVFATFLGGNSLDDAYGIALDADNNVYLTGLTQSQNFPLVGPVQASIGSPCPAIPCTADFFVAKIKADGRELLFSSYLGGFAAEQPRAVTVDRQGQIYIVGNTTSVNFPTANPFQATYTGGGPVIACLARISME